MVILKSMNEENKSENSTPESAETAPTENKDNVIGMVPESQKQEPVHEQKKEETGENVQPVAPVTIEWKKPLLITFIICVAGVLLMYFLKK